MTYKLYSVRDKKSGFWAPRIEINEAVAVRNFSQMVNAGDTVINFSPNDFDLYCVGSFDDQKGLLESQVPEFVYSASDLVGGAD